MIHPAIKPACLLPTLLLALSCALGEPAYVWIEGEKHEKANFEPKVRDGQTLFSAKEWITHMLNPREAQKRTPAEGFQLAYSFDVPSAGQYDFWARIGYEWVRTPFEWRVDGGDWQKVSLDVVTTSLMEVGFWCEVAWTKGGAAELSRGRHELEMRWMKPEPKKRLLIGLDCLAFVKGDFVPEGALKPGQQYEAEIDRQAAAHVFGLTGDLPDSSAERAEIPLSGLWQVARYDDPDMDQGTFEPIKSLPSETDHPLRWMGLEVPGDSRKREELRQGHRLLYRCKVQVPAGLKGRGFHLHFSGTNWIASVFVNGQYAGARQSVLVPWDIDVTKLVKPGEVNTIVVGIKSPWYAADAKARGKKSVDEMRNVPISHCRYTTWLAAIYPSSKGEGNGVWTGIVNPVTLVATGAVKTTDIYVRTSVVKKRLDADVTVLNATDRDADISIKCEAIHERTREVEKTFGPTTMAVPAGSSRTAKLGGEWSNPKLWWPEEGADLYIMRTTVTRDGRPIDVHKELFGFREVGIEGKHFLLNGIRWHFWNWVDVGRVSTEKEWLERYHAQNDRFHRISHDHDKLWGYREKALEFHDRHGIPGRLSTCIDGMFITHDLTNPVTWTHFKNHVRQVVLAYRNHPSVMMWSLGNEVMIVTAFLRYFRHYPDIEEKAAELSRIAKELDPTRASFQDGGGDLGGLIEMNCQHYSWKRGSDFPRGAYDYDVPPDGQPVQPRPRDRHLMYLWDKQRPLILGEVFYYANNPDRVAWFGGPQVYRSMVESDKAAVRYARLAIEGARWQDVTGICPWVHCLPGAKKSFEPRAVFVREHNSCFFPGMTVARTVKVFNDGRKTDPLTLKWRLVLGDREVAKGEGTYHVLPGRHQEDTIGVQLPDVTSRQHGQLDLALYAEGKPVFDDSKPISLLPRPTGKYGGLEAKGPDSHRPGKQGERMAAGTWPILRGDGDLG